ncbi:MAG TPA: helix-turn-helix domain-containing protein [Thermomicrobiales bacterium]|nr:helix-turn-helix domain-containing protein [Thermomicrobiales bacterium]
MGNREDLLVGARKCLLDKGYVQTTARDIATASGVSLAAIGYHFGTKEKLLQEAMAEANAEWGERLVESASSVEVPAQASWAEWFERVWRNILDDSTEDQRMMLASLEVLANVDPSAPVHFSIGERMSCARDALVSLFGHDTEALTAEQLEALGTFYFALDIGARVLGAVSPGCGPSSHQLVMALQAIAPRICEELSETVPEDAVAD